MDIEWKQELTKTSYQLMREAGYLPITDRRSGKQSYVYRLTSNRYPRFHVYIEEEEETYLKIHLHLDHREHGFGQKLHDTEYQGANVEQESARIQRWLKHFTVTATEEDETDEKGFFTKLFGG